MDAADPAHRGLELPSARVSHLIRLALATLIPDTLKQLRRRTAKKTEGALPPSSFGENHGALFV